MKKKYSNVLNELLVGYAFNFKRKKMNRIEDIDMYSPDLDQKTRMNLMFDFIIRIGYGKSVCQFLCKDELENLRKVNTQCNEIIPIYVERWGSKWNSYDFCKEMIVVDDKKRRCSNVLWYNWCNKCDNMDDTNQCVDCGCPVEFQRGVCDSCLGYPDPTSRLVDPPPRIRGSRTSGLRFGCLRVVDGRLRAIKP